MHPHDLFGLAPFFLGLTLAATMATLIVLFYLGREFGLARVALLQIGVAIAAIAGAKLFSLYERDWRHFGDFALEVQSGWRYPGALIAILLVAPAIKQVVLPGLSVMRFLDVTAIGTAIALGVYRINCFMSGCCTGKACEGGFCLEYSTGSVVWKSHYESGLISQPGLPSLPVVPLHLYFMACSLIVAAILVRADRSRSFDGQICFLFLFCHEGAKFVLEWFREPMVPELMLVSAIAAMAGALGLWVFGSSIRIGNARYR